MKAKHIHQETLTRYVYRSLDDASRDEIDRHLSDCAYCRTRLSEAQAAQRRIKEEIAGALKTQRPSEKMAFSAIASEIAPPNPLGRLFQKTTGSSTFFLVAAGFILALIGAWEVFVDRSIDIVNPQLGAFPTVAGFLFMIASVQEFDRSLADRPRFSFMMIIAALLWLGSGILGLLDIIVIRDLTIFAVVSAGGNATTAEPITIIAVMLAACLYIGVVIGGAEYHYKHFGQPGSWKLFTFTLLGQLFLLVLPYIML